MNRKFLWVLVFTFIASISSTGAWAASWDNLNNQVADLFRAGKYEQAIPVAQKALDEAEYAYGANSSQTALSVNNLALLYKKTGRNKAAETNYLKALGIFEKIAGIDHPDVCVPLNNLALFYQSTGDRAKAQSYSKRALTILENALGKAHPSTVEARNRYNALIAAR